MNVPEIREALLLAQELDTIVDHQDARCPNVGVVSQEAAAAIRHQHARCAGRYTELEGSREIFDRPVKLVSVECSGCLRRTAPRPDPYWGMTPPAFENGKCPSKIEPSNQRKIM
jgi:hypothetical protein